MMGSLDWYRGLEERGTTLGVCIAHRSGQTQCRSLGVFCKGRVVAMQR